MQKCLLVLEILNFSPKYRGGVKGFGSDAVIAFTDFCFTKLNLHKVYLRVFESNKRAICCYEKAGYKVEGRLVEHHFSNGEYEDVLLMGKTKS